MAINGFSVAQCIVVRVQGGRGGIVTVGKVVDPRAAAKISIKRFDLAACGNFLSEFIDAEIMQKVTNQGATVIVMVSLGALDSND